VVEIPGFKRIPLLRVVSILQMFNIENSQKLLCVVQLYSCNTVFIVELPENRWGATWGISPGFKKKIESRKFIKNQFCVRNPVFP